MLGKILDERPDNVVDIFEDISKDSKRTKFTSDANTVQDKVDRSTEVALAQVQRKLFTVRDFFYLKKYFLDTCLSKMRLLEQVFFLCLTHQPYNVNI